MNLAHAAHDHGGGTGALLPLLAVGVLAAGYLALAAARHHDGRGWDFWRTTSFLAGCALLALGLAPQLLPYPAGDFREHMLQHLLIGMPRPARSGTRRPGDAGAAFGSVSGGATSRACVA